MYVCFCKAAQSGTYYIGKPILTLLSDLLRGCGVSSNTRYVHQATAGAAAHTTDSGAAYIAYGTKDALHSLHTSFPPQDLLEIPVIHGFHSRWDLRD